MTDTIDIRIPATPIVRNREWSFSFADMVSSMEQLTTLLEEENTLLANMRVKAIGDLQEKKSQLTWLLELQKQHLEKNPDLLIRLDDETRLHLTRIAVTMEKAIAENHHRLTTARLINHKIVQAVTAALSDSIGEARGYGESGARGLVITKDSGNIPPLTLNESV